MRECGSVSNLFGAKSLAFRKGELGFENSLLFLTMQADKKRSSKDRNK